MTGEVLLKLRLFEARTDLKKNFALSIFINKEFEGINLEEDRDLVNNPPYCNRGWGGFVTRCQIRISLTDQFSLYWVGKSFHGTIGGK